MGVSRRQLLAGSASALWLSACGGGGGSGSSGGETGGTAEKIAWTVDSRGVTGFPLSSVCHGNSITLAAGSNGIGSNANVFRAISRRNSDGSWTAVHVSVISEFSSITGLTFGNGRFVAVTSLGQIVTSTDGATWALAADLRATGDVVELYGCTFGNGKFAITGIRNTSTPVFVSATSCWTSLDGLEWSDPVATGIEFQSAPIAFANGKLYAFSGSMAVSADTGATWQSLLVSVGGVSVTVNGLAYGQGLYLAAVEGGYVATSPDFVTWTVRAQVLNANGPFYGATYSNGYFFALLDRTILSSPDGITWTQTTIGQAWDTVNSVVFDGKVFVAVGDPGLTVEGTIS
jgi:hypothetical protein